MKQSVQRALTISHLICREDKGPARVHVTRDDLTLALSGANHIYISTHTRFERKDTIGWTNGKDP